MCLGGSPPSPAPLPPPPAPVAAPPPPPTPVSEEVRKAATDTRKQAAASSTRKGTILTGAQGLGVLNEDQGARKTLLGA